MRGFIIRLLITALGIWMASEIVPGVHMAGVSTLLAAALLLGVVNAIIRPVVILLTLPITVLTLGLFYLVVNGLAFALAALLVPGFHVHQETGQGGPHGEGSPGSQGQADPHRHHPSAHHPGDDTSGRRPEGQPDPHLPDPPAHRVGHDPIDPHGTEGQSREGEKGHEEGVGAILA